jgi:alpha-beta hydrolase superfamily lysophospholipase
MTPSTSQFLAVRGLSYHVRSWGDAAAPKLFMLHGWMDVGASFQFLVDALARDWCVLAPDWRGFGQSAWCEDGYWFADYLADLDALLEHFTPDAPARVVRTQPRRQRRLHLWRRAAAASRAWFRSKAWAFRPRSPRSHPISC